MKHKLLFAFTIAISCAFITNPFAYRFMTVTATGKGGYVPEKTTAVYQKPKGKATTNDYIISGVKSPIRLKIVDAVFNAISEESTATLDPALYISLYKVTSGKTSRTLSITPEGGGTMWLPINISRPDGYNIRITPGVAMVPGEYVIVDKTTITSEGNYTVWAFGID